MSIGNNLSLSFNENIAPGTGAIQLYDSANTLVETFTVGSSAGLSISGSTLTINPAADLQYSTGYYLNVDAGAITDIAGNAYGGFSTATTLNFTTAGAPDTTGPVVTSVAVPTNATYRAGQNLDFTVNFDEPVSVGGSPRLALTVGSTGVHAAYLSGAGTSSLVFRYVVQSGDLDADGVAVGALDLNGGTLKDAANNNATLTLNSVGSTSSVLVDAVAPTVSTPDLDAASDSRFTTDDITNDTTPTFTGSAEVNATVTLYGSDGSTVLGTTTADGSGNWSITSSALPPGIHTVTAKATDAAGNVSAASSALAIRVDTADPTASFTTPSDGATGVAVSGNLVLTFSETVTANGIGNIVIKTVTGNNTVATLDASAASVVGTGASTTATIAYSGLSHSTDYYVTLASGAFLDIAGNSYAGTTSTGTAGWDFTTSAAPDTTAPTVAIARGTPSTSPTNYDTLVYRVTFSEPVSSVDATDFTVSGTTATVSNVTSAGGSVYDVTVSGGDLVNLNATVNLGISSNSNIADAANNPLNQTPTSTAGYVVDNLAPTVTITDNVPGTATGSVTFTFSFDEDVTGFDAADVTVSAGATKGTMTAVDARTYTLPVSPPANATGNMTVDVGLNAAVDSVINGNAAATQAVQAFNTAPPPAAPPAAPPEPPPAPPTALTTDLVESNKAGLDGSALVTNQTVPNFDIAAGSILRNDQTARLLDPAGNVVGSTPVTTQDVQSGSVTVPTRQLDDGRYTFTAQIVDNTGRVVGQSQITVLVVTDRDGVMPSVELAANGGDYNRDRVPDWEQPNVTQLPLMSMADYKLGKNAPQGSFGAMMVGRPDENAPSGIALESTAQLVDVQLVSPPSAPLPVSTVAVSPMFAFTVLPREGSVLADSDPVREGLQVQTIISLPRGFKADAFLKFNAATQSWYNYANPAAYNGSVDGAALRDTNGDGLIDRIVITVTDGGIGDEDGKVNGMIVDPGMLADTGSRSPLTIFPDRDGVSEEVERASGRLDYNQDGLEDWDQGGIAQLPLATLEAFNLGKAAPASSFGTLMVGKVDASSPIGAYMDAAGQLQGITVSGLPKAPPVGYQSASPMLGLQAAPAPGVASLTDVDLTREGLQTQIIEYLATGVQANAYLLFDPQSQTWFDYTDPSALNGSADGAALLDLNNDGLIDAVVVTITDNGIGDDDITVNGIISLHGMLGWIAAEGV